MNINIMDAAMNTIVTLPIYTADGDLNLFPAGISEVEVPIGKTELTSGKYSITVGVINADSKSVLTRVQGLCPFRVISDRVHWGMVVRHVVPQKVNFLPPHLQTKQ